MLIISLSFQSFFSTFIENKIINEINSLIELWKYCLSDYFRQNFS